MPQDTSGKAEAGEAPHKPLRAPHKRCRGELPHEVGRFLRRLALPGRVLDELHRLRNLLLYEREQGLVGPVLGITSAVPKEGVSFIAFHLAVTLAKSIEQSILLVDAHFSSPALHRYFDVPNTTGFSEALEGQTKIDRAIQRTAVPNLCFMSSGEAFFDSGHLSRPGQLTGIMKRLRELFDLVIIDMAPICQSSESLVMGSAVDHVILVVRAHRTKHQVVEHAKEEISKYGGKLLGILLNARRFFIPRFIYRWL